MRRLIPTLLGLALLTAAGAAAVPNQSAIVTNFAGKILVNHGKGFTKAQPNVTLNIGDSVFIGDDSSVTISYTTAQCNITYTTPQTLVLPAKAPCNAGETLSEAGNLSIQPANFVGGFVAGGGPNASWAGLGVFGVASFTGIYTETTRSNGPVSGP